jgi:hypothetical protein
MLSTKRRVPSAKQTTPPRPTVEVLEGRNLPAIGFGTPQLVMIHGGAFTPPQTGYADVNGDGKADMLFQGTDNRFWLSLSTGTGFSTPRLVMRHGGPFAPGQTGYADVNGDHKW